MHQPRVVIPVVEIQVGTSLLLGRQLETFRLLIAADGERSTAFHAREDRNQPVLGPIACQNRAGPVFFLNPPRRQVFERPAELRGNRVGVRRDLSGARDAGSQADQQFNCDEVVN